MDRDEIPLCIYYYLVVMYNILVRTKWKFGWRVLSFMYIFMHTLDLNSVHMVASTISTQHIIYMFRVNT